ncbi:MAG: NAD-dependent epimerase/dehydratase family protein [Bacteroidetes bacterium]|nr:NAD-dependent epimerase/dehydratase family protein [Bacteroidota bacterium]
MTEPTASVLGCGYIGRPLAKLLLDRGWRVRGSTTSETKLDQLLSDGVEPYLLKLTPDLQGRGRRDFFDSDVVVLNFPPGRRRADVKIFMESAMESLLFYLKGGNVQKVLFVSSTSVYRSGHVREEDAGKLIPETASGCALLAAEKTVKSACEFQTTILRCGGLYGYERKPGRFWSGRLLRNPQNSVNLVHRDDAVGIALATIMQNCWGETFNVCADQHPSRAEFYTQAALRLGIALPKVGFDESQSDKVVLNHWVRKRLGYAFKYPDPLTPAP